MKKVWTGMGTVLAALLTVGVASCGKSGEGAHKVVEAGGRSRIVNTESHRFVFDLLTGRTYGPVKAALTAAPADADSAVSLTVVALPEKKPVEAQQVRLKILDPSGKTLSEQVLIWRDHGMVQYLAPFRREKEGKYTVEMQATAGGHAQSQKVTFDL